MTTRPAEVPASRPWHSLSGRIVLVTGASRGIGRGIALALGEAGATVACAARSADELEATAARIREQGGDARTFRFDVTRTGDIDAGVRTVEETVGPIDVLVNNAGIVLEKKAVELSDADWALTLDTNLTSMFRCARAVAPAMIARGRGKIINIGSMWGSVGVSRHVAYCVSKAGVEALTRCLAVEWARHGIQVNCLAPGYVSTDFNRQVMADERLRTFILSKIPLRRIAEPDEVGALAVYLSSSASDFMTGQTIHLDGGQTIAG
jgi:NAD(P)-dependent dehydrogenase (short-subunit alcohol dehydrogenase family)